jgi:polar amino acid transport system substrate-binding protein
MKKKNLMITLSMLTMALMLSMNSCNTDDLADNTIQISGVEFEPNYFLEDGEIVGIDADIADKAMKNAGIAFEMSMSDSWQSANEVTIVGPNRAMLTTAYTPERKDLFKWAGPTSQSMYAIFENGFSGHIFPVPIEVCKLLSNIAVVKNWLETTTLEELGFKNLAYYDTYSEALDAFISGETKFIASDFYHLAAKLPPEYLRGGIFTVTRYRTVYNYIAFSKDVSDEVVNKIQRKVEAMIKDQSAVSIVKKYFPLMPADYMPGTIQLFTEVSPPFSYVTGKDTTRKVMGSTVDIVNEIQKRTGHINKINMSVWSDAYAVIQYLPNSALFNTTRTPEREKMFQWVGPVSKSKSFFYTLSSSGLTIETLEQAKNLQSIATPNGWFTHDFLVKNNFQNIVATPRTSIDAFNLLIEGEVQALLIPDLDLIWLANMNNVPISNLTQHVEVLNYMDYIAFSLNTPESTVQQWQNLLDAMKADGTFKMIWDKWFEGVPMP